MATENLIHIEDVRRFSHNNNNNNTNVCSALAVENLIYDDSKPFVVVGCRNGALNIFEWDQNSKLIAMAENLGFVSCIVSGDILNQQNNPILKPVMAGNFSKRCITATLVVISLEGLCCVYFNCLGHFYAANNGIQSNFTDKKTGLLSAQTHASHSINSSSNAVSVSSHVLQPYFMQQLPSNIRAALVADVDGDGLNEILVALTDRVIRSYRHTPCPKHRGRLVALNKWEVPSIITCLSLRYTQTVVENIKDQNISTSGSSNNSMHEQLSCVELLVSQPTRKYVTFLARTELYGPKPEFGIKFNALPSLSLAQNPSTTSDKNTKCDFVQRPYVIHCNAFAAYTMHELSDNIVLIGGDKRDIIAANIDLPFKAFLLVALCDYDILLCCSWNGRVCAVNVCEPSSTLGQVVDLCNLNLPVRNFSAWIAKRDIYDGQPAVEIKGNRLCSSTDADMTRIREHDDDYQPWIHIVFATTFQQIIGAKISMHQVLNHFNDDDGLCENFTSTVEFDVF